MFLIVISLIIDQISNKNSNKNNEQLADEFENSSYPTQSEKSYRIFDDRVKSIIGTITEAFASHRTHNIGGGIQESDESLKTVKATLAAFAAEIY